FTEVQNVSGYRVQVELVRFYLSDLRLTQGSNSAQLAEISLIDITNGPIETLVNANVGSWSGLSMGLGVRTDLNHSDPTLYANDHPLSASNGMHWDWVDEYIFTKFEGRHGTLVGSSGAFPNTFSIHTGFDTAYAHIDLLPAVPYNVIKGDTTTIHVHIAIDRFFHSDEGGTIDLADEYFSHGMNVPLSMKLSGNVKNSFTVD
ncbi:MAG: hypothetical protein M3R08_09410, partial [Bacteroidota bacterium]|nr:hypothetical protein [Bacteroidota bacterium]